MAAATVRTVYKLDADAPLSRCEDWFSESQVSPAPFHVRPFSRAQELFVRVFAWPARVVGRCSPVVVEGGTVQRRVQVRLGWHGHQTDRRSVRFRPLGELNLLRFYGLKHFHENRCTLLNNTSTWHSQY